MTSGQRVTSQRAGGRTSARVVLGEGDALAGRPCNLHNARLFDDETRVDEARAICKRQCPQLIECRAWALRNDVAGVCGGFTEVERVMWRRDNGVSLPAAVVVLPRDRCRRPPPEVTAERRTAAVAMHAKGYTQRQIASALGVTQQCVWLLLKTAREAVA